MDPASPLHCNPTNAPRAGASVTGHYPDSLEFLFGAPIQYRQVPVAEGKRETSLRRDIEILQASTKSIMPEGLEQELTPQDLADLIRFVQEAFR